MAIVPYILNNHCSLLYLQLINPVKDHLEFLTFLVYFWQGLVQTEGCVTANLQCTKNI